MPEYMLQVVHLDGAAGECHLLSFEDDDTARAASAERVKVGTVAKLWEHRRYLGTVVPARLLELRQIAADAVQVPGSQRPRSIPVC